MIINLICNNLSIYQIMKCLRAIKEILRMLELEDKSNLSFWNVNKLLSPWKCCRWHFGTSEFCEYKQWISKSQKCTISILCGQKNMWWLFQNSMWWLPFDQFGSLLISVDLYQSEFRLCNSIFNTQKLSSSLEKVLYLHHQH